VCVITVTLLLLLLSVVVVSLVCVWVSLDVSEVSSCRCTHTCLLLSSCVSLVEKTQNTHTHTHSKQGSLQRVREGVQRLAQVILGASHLAQSVVPALLMPPSSGDDDDDEKMRHWKSNIRRTLEGQAHAFCRALADNRFVHVLRPQGAMYAMLKIHADDDIIHSDICFVRMLLEEENVFCLPGQAFGCEPKNGDNEIYLRVTFLASEETLQEAAKRIDRFCQRHAHTAADAIHS